MENKIDVVITMGGLGSRFRKAGYKVPKYMIEAKGKTLFEWSIISLEGYKKDVVQYIFIAMKDEDLDIAGFVRSKCEELGIIDYHLILLDYLTDGQATTATLAEKYWNSEHALLIYNIDTYVEPGQMNSEELRGDGFIPCFKAEGDHWSFVRLDEQGRVVEIKEKQRISDHCTLGAYYFSSARLYRELYEEFYSDDSQMEKNEKYIAPLYNLMIEKGMPVTISIVDAAKVHVLGTPEELQVFLSE